MQARSNHNKTACALANKLARTCNATLRDGEPFDEKPQARLGNKMQRQAFSNAAGA